jgi:hypothetical protein
MSITTEEFSYVMQAIKLQRDKPAHNVYFRRHLVVDVRDNTFIIHYTDPFDDTLYRVLISLKGEHVNPLFNVPDSLEKFKNCFSVTKPLF